MTKQKDYAKTEHIKRDIIKRKGKDRYDRGFKQRINI